MSTDSQRGGPGSIATGGTNEPDGAGAAPPRPAGDSQILPRGDLAIRPAAPRGEALTFISPGQVGSEALVLRASGSLIVCCAYHRTGGTKFRGCGADDALAFAAAPALVGYHCPVDTCTWWTPDRKAAVEHMTCCHGMGPVAR